MSKNLVKQSFLEESMNKKFFYKHTCAPHLTQDPNFFLSVLIAFQNIL